MGNSNESLGLRNDLMGWVEMLEQLANYGLPAAISAALLYVLIVLIREHQRNFDDCNNRVERLIETHHEFIKETSQDMAALIERMNKVSDKIEKLIDKIIESGGKQ